MPKINTLISGNYIHTISVIAYLNMSGKKGIPINKDGMSYLIITF